MFPGFSFTALLEELAAPREVPGAGSALAAALAAAAAVVQMAARLSPASWADAAGVAAQAEALRERAVQLVDEDAEAYRLALEARAAADEGAKPEQRDWSLGQVTAAPEAAEAAEEGSAFTAQKATQRPSPGTASSLRVAC